MRVVNLRAAQCIGLAAVFTLLGAVAGAADAPAAPPQAPEAAAAVWTPKELNFIYQGFTSRYSCGGLRDRMRQVLLTLGARADLDVGPWGCTSADGRPDPFPGVRIRMNVLTAAPATAAQGAAGAAATVVGAHWKKVDVRLDKDPLSEAGSCELLEQIRHKVLPQFTTRNVDFASNCVPNQLTAGGTWLRAEVLIADKSDKPLASK